MAEQVGKFLTELPELETPTDDDAMYIVDGSTASKKITMSNLKRVLGGNVTGTVEDTSVSFSDGADGIPMEECEVTLVPSQDLHGYSKPWAGGAGKNLLDTSTWRDTFVQADVTFTKIGDGHYKVNGTANATTWVFFIVGNQNIDISLPTGTYTLSARPNGLNVYIYRDSGYTDYVNGGVSITSTNKPVYGIRFIMATGTTFDNVDMYFQIEENSTMTEWEPYSNICPISGHSSVTVTVASTSGGSGEDTTVSLGRTVYGGTLDVTTGELVVTSKGVDLGTLTWTSQGTSDASKYRMRGLITPDIAKAVPNNQVFNAICSIYEAISANNTYSCNLGISGDNTGNYIFVYDENYNQSTDAPNFTSFVNGQYLVYELATPQTFNLTPTQVLTLLGQNYVSHDGGGNIKVVYIRDLDIVINDLIDRVTALENE